ncbi:hypothetical protein NC651_000119 [Populus alba x Populus x berolinensis]|nr:hypothetical protein NC651_000119 [Populus alba x Populus x berolinensis]
MCGHGQDHSRLQYILRRERSQQRFGTPTRQKARREKTALQAMAVHRERKLGNVGEDGLMLDRREWGACWGLLAFSPAVAPP